jgi:aminoglycoside 6'-N-acetyltransferase I
VPSRIRLATPADLDIVVGLRAALWPNTPAGEHAAEAAAILEGNPRSTLPLVLLVAEDSAGVVTGFAEVGLRSHADGCDPGQAVGFLEGWYVRPEYRRRGIGRALVAAAEIWAGSQGCAEIASDTWADNFTSNAAHQALGFELVERRVTYRKGLT